LEKKKDDIEESRIHLVDAHVGKRLRQRRQSLNLSQEKLANILGLTFQQVQKYENGSNRISASRLFEIAKALNAPIAFFFDGLTGSLKPVLSSFHEDRANYNARSSSLQDHDPDLVEITKIFSRIKDRQLKLQLISMARVLAARQNSA